MSSYITRYPALMSYLALPARRALPDAATLQEISVLST
jgi:hypothetical protein